MTLPPLAWVLHQPAVVTLDGDHVQRWGCHKLDGLARPVRRGEVLWRNHAPTLCSTRRPNVELRLSRQKQRRPTVHCRPQEFRASWESIMRADGVDAADRATYAGHSIETANRRYVQALDRSADRVRAAIG